MDLNTAFCIRDSQTLSSQQQQQQLLKETDLSTHEAESKPVDSISSLLDFEAIISDGLDPSACLDSDLDVNVKQSSSVVSEKVFGHDSTNTVLAPESSTTAPMGDGVDDMSSSPSVVAKKPRQTRKRKHQEDDDDENKENDGSPVSKKQHTKVTNAGVRKLGDETNRKAKQTGRGEQHESIIENVIL